VQGANLANIQAVKHGHEGILIGPQGWGISEVRLRSKNMDHTPTDNLTATFYVKDPESGVLDNCETFYATDRDSWLVQGKRRGPQVAAQIMNLAEDETFLEVSDRTVDAFVRKYVKENHGVDLA
jgi:hypothetical protein